MNAITDYKEPIEFPPLSKEELDFYTDVVLNLMEHYPQVDIPIEHFIHEGVYYRTCKVPKGATVVGALIKIPTTVIVSGKCKTTVGTNVLELNGYCVLKGKAGRRQVFVALEDTNITMCFKTNATTVEEAEKRFTDRWRFLTNHLGDWRGQCQV